ncbi:hypothetical protein ABIA70_003920 [Arthrobacter sp. 754]
MLRLPVAPEVTGNEGFWNTGAGALNELVCLSRAGVEVVPNRP